MFTERILLAPEGDDDDLYSGFNDVIHPALDTRTLQQDESFQEAVLKSSYGRRGFTGKRITGPSRMGTAGFRRTGATPNMGSSHLRRTSMGTSGQPPTTARPMTAVRGAGYSSRVPGPAFDPLNQAKSAGSTFQYKDDSSPESKIKQLEGKVSSLLEESIACSHRGEMKLSLEKAKEAVTKEKQLSRQKERLSTVGTESGISVNLDLTFSVLFNLGLQFAKNEMFTEAINTYTSITKDRSFSNSGRLKVNIGSIHFVQENYAKAIKSFRMALDQVPNTQKDMRMKIMQNIGLSFVRLNQYTDAITSFEYIMAEKPDYRTALHLIICHFALDDRESMKKAFIDLLSIGTKDKTKPQVLRTFTPPPSDEDDPHYIQLNEVIRSDQLKVMEKEKTREHHWCILMASKLIAPVVGDTVSSGYEWTVTQVAAAGYIDMASDLEISKAVKHLKKREFTEAIQTLKTFERKDSRSASTAATNLSFMYLLQNEVSTAEKYADEAIDSDRFNASALVNKGNCCFVQNQLEKARDFYREALNIESTSAEALYNFMLTSKKLGHYDTSLDAAFKFNYIVKNHSYSLYQVANIYEIINDREQSLEWYHKLLAFVPSDPSLLNKLSDISEADRDKHQAFAYLTESFRYFPSHIPTIERLAAHYIESQVYEKAIVYLEKAAQVQPLEIKWLLMIAACHRRSGNYQQALVFYTKTHRRFPENMECLKFLIRICNDLDLPEGTEYLEKLKRLEKAKEASARKDLRSSSRSSKRSATSSREGSASSNSSGYMTESSRMNSRRSNPDPSHREEVKKETMIDDLEKNARPTTSWKRKPLEEDDFGGDDINEFLPE